MPRVPRSAHRARSGHCGRRSGARCPLLVRHAGRSRRRPSVERTLDSARAARAPYSSARRTRQPRTGTTTRATQPSRRTWPTTKHRLQPRPDGNASTECVAETPPLVVEQSRRQHFVDRRANCQERVQPGDEVEARSRGDPGVRGAQDNGPRARVLIGYPCHPTGAFAQGSAPCSTSPAHAGRSKE